MIELSQLPAVNAALNGVAFFLLLRGFLHIRAGNLAAHRRCMIAAFVVSLMFLTTYLTYRIFGAEKRFTGQGLVRPIYFFILITHVVLAACVPVLAGRTLYLAVRGRFDEHRRLARLTFPIWMYVSVTGIFVYVFLFQLYKT